MPHRQSPWATKHARELRARQTEAESLLWQALRARRLCGLKFRRQHPLEPYIADFACIAKRFIVEIDGGYHDYVYAGDMCREEHLRNLGWNIVRFSNDDVLSDVETVAIAIARHLGMPPTFRGKSPS